MLLRFSLYGFLKNQRYFEPFLVLVLLEKGFDFFLIGLLIGFRAVTVNLLEIPSGALADASGRRGSMILSFAAYIVCFLIFGFAENVVAIFVAMFFYGIGDAFRSGTHKAMIFEWLRQEGRTDDRTEIYGFTRSWSKIGSAVSGLIAAGLVLWMDRYTPIFFFATIPYALDIVNFLGYPKSLDGAHEKTRSPREVVRRLRRAIRDAAARRPLRRLLAETMGFEGVFHAVKDYLQPVLQALVVAGVAAGLATRGPLDDLSDVQRTALVVGPVYAVLYILAAVASRQSHRVAEAAGSEERAARWLWGLGVIVYIVLAAGAAIEVHVVAAIAFVALHVLQNLWRPVLISRFDNCSEAEEGATVLSLESQSQRAATMVLAPLLGAAIDAVERTGWGGSFWPVGAFGAVAALAFWITAIRRDTPHATIPSSEA